MIFASTFTTLYYEEKEIVFVLLLRSLCYDLAKKKISIYILTLLSLSIYLVVAANVHYAMILKQNKINFYSNNIFTTQFLIKKEWDFSPQDS